MKVEIKKELEAIFYAPTLTTDERFVKKAIDKYENRETHMKECVVELIKTYRKSELVQFIDTYLDKTDINMQLKLIDLKDDVERHIYENLTYSQVKFILDEKNICWTGCSAVNFSTVINTHPSYQRELVWSLQQKKDYVLYRLRGGLDVLIFNERMIDGNYISEVVDGQQRLNALLEFANGSFAINYNNQELYYKDILYPHFKIEYRRLELEDPIDVLDFYIKLNSAGKNHTYEEIERARIEIEKLNEGKL